MKKFIRTKIIFVVTLLIFGMLIVINVKRCQQIDEFSDVNKESNSERYINAYVRSILDGYTEEYHHDFATATSDMENVLYGIWQVKESVGYDSSMRVNYDGGYGDILIFAEDAWVKGGIPAHKPVYSYYESKIEDMETDDWLHLRFVDERYEGRNGLIIIGIASEHNRAFGSAVKNAQIRLVLIDDTLLLERDGSYFVMEKIGEANIYQSIENVSPN